TDIPYRLPLTYNNEEHIVKIVQSGDIIQDSTQAEIDSAQSGFQSSFHAWQYFYDHIAVPIKQHLENTFVNGVPLKETIRYIVLCKGIPFKIQAMGDWSGINTPQKNVSLQSLLSLLNNEPYLTTLEDLYSTPINRENPYNMKNNDNYYYLDYRFLPDFYVNPAGRKLSYLVTRLDGLSYSDVVQMIDNAVNADTSGQRTWILDAAATGFGASSAAADLLNLLEFEVYYDETSEYITNNQLFNNNQVICYQSGGHNSGMPEGYIQNLLTFSYAPGAVFNTFESFNGNSFGEITRRAEHGLLTEFIKKGGTGGLCYPWEPGGSTSNCITGGNIFFPAYALGYNLVDAIYMNMPNLFFQNVIAGDPLTRIYKVYPKNTIASDTTITSGDIEGIKIIVPQGRTLTIASGSVINFKRNAQLVVHGNIIIEPDVELHFKAMSRFSINSATFDNTIVLDFSDYSIFQINDDLTLGENFILNLFDNSKVVSNKLTFNSDFTINFYNGSKLIAEDVTIEGNPNLNFYNSSSF
ncbi:MAG TPA: TIGR03790 family protein, partial [Bacteroidia bacterium]|nr:TIGR03790 family protein [Bacteroidia bacterium]